VRSVPERLVATRPESPADWDSVAKIWQRPPAQTLWRRHSDRVNSALVERWLPGGTGHFVAFRATRLA
jgi:hypothetical protein